MISVYVKTDTNGNITAVNSSVFLSEEEQSSWTKIDKGEGDRFAHAQGNYFDNSLTDENGCYNYKLLGSEVIDVKPQEKQTIISSRTESKTELESYKEMVDDLMLAELMRQGAIIND